MFILKIEKKKETKILFLANVGGWIKSNQDSEVVDLELDEAEDISQDKSIGPESPSTPLAPSKSQTKM